MSSLLVLAFLSPIINGTGFAFKEVKGGAGKVEEVRAKINEKQKKIVEVYC